MHFGLNIKHLREKANLTQKELGAKLSIDYTTVGGWEKGKSTPRVEIILQIRELFQIDMESLFFKNLSEDKVEERKPEYGTSNDELINELKQEIQALREMIDTIRGSVKKIEVQDARIALLERQLELLLEGK